MKKLSFLLAIIFIATTYNYAQWSGSTSTTTGTIYRSGWVGLHDCTSPIAPLSIETNTGYKGIFLGLKTGAEGTNSPMLIFDSRNGGADNFFFIRQEGNSLKFNRYEDFWTGGLNLLTLDGAGYVGLGTGTPAAALHVIRYKTDTYGKKINSILGNGYDHWTLFGGTTGGGIRGSNEGYLVLESNPNGSGNKNIYMRCATGGNIIMAQSGANVGIGTTTPTAKLTVKGNILASKIEIKNDSEIPASDFVFNEEYNLRSLAEVEQFVKENKHLPEVPSADEFKENGYSVGEMDDILLRKVEELTLYIIELKKEKDLEIQELQNQIEILKKTK